MSVQEEKEIQRYSTNDTHLENPVEENLNCSINNTKNQQKKSARKTELERIS